jgi:hypothetical protein
MPTCVGFPLTESAQADFVGCGGAVLTAGIINAKAKPAFVGKYTTQGRMGAKYFQISV